MTDLGETLRKARLERGMTLEELEELTKIRKRYLQAIESQNFEVLPGNFYARAFIKNYAEAVGLDPEQIMQMYKNVIPSTESTPHIEVTRPPARSSHFNIERWSKWASALLMVSFFLLIVVLIYFYVYQADSNKDTVMDETPITDRIEQTDSNQDPEPDTASSQQPVVQEPEPEPEPEPEVTFVNSSGSLDIYTISNADKVQVELEIVGPECWVSVNKDNRDGELLFMDTLKHGDKMSWEYEGALWIRLGQASSAAVTVNGVPLEPFEHPNVRDLQLNLAASEDNWNESEGNLDE